MKKYYTRSDLAIESLALATQDKDYKRFEKKDGNITIETFEILQTSDLYPHEIGQYVEISFPDYQDVSTIAKHFEQQLSLFIKEKTKKIDPLILFVGLGNETLTSDAIGPRTIKHLRATHHYPLDERHHQQYYDSLCIAPGVMAHTGMETADIVSCLVNEYRPDLIIAIDALCAQSYEKICHVIQMNNVGIYPGSGIGNHRKSITETSMGVPVIAIGIPTVIHVSSLVSDVYNLLEGYFKESLDPSTALKVGKRKRYEGRLNEVQRRLILGEIGQLDEQKRIQLLNEVLNPIEDQFVMSDKQIDFDIEMISKILSTSINNLRY
ncbi:GPR endopeptidase [Candidatus Stoquefichus massiliensis]|uniref:GPR endopeptidase n=1 Tax=Candidatus Stoquefichus massiliensis TaxID=1470350 RepID=UPI00047FEBB9|nr:GPR endopeptidase [Candidatus Stoquefichus massiliensis]